MGDHGLYGELKTKLRDCLHPDYNFRYPKNEKVISCEENKNSIRCTVNPEEIACLFVVDEQFDGSCKLDNPCNCLGSSNSCDLILYMNTGRLKTVTFVELKGTNVNHAILQIKETIKNFKDKFDKQQWRYKVLAVIVYSGSAPRKIKDKELKSLLDKFPFLKKRQFADITGYVKNA